MPIKVPALVSLVVLGMGCVSCASKSEPAPAAPEPPFEFAGAWGTPGDEPGQLRSPAGIAADSRGLVYIADTGSQFIHKFDVKGQALLSFQDSGLRAPTAIAVDSGGGIYVADRDRSVIFIFAPDGKRIGSLRGGPGRGFKHPTSVAVDAEGSIFVAELDASRVQKLSPRGRFLFAWGRGESAPEFVGALSAIALGEDGMLYVADEDSRRILKLAGDSDSEQVIETVPGPSDSAGNLVALAVGRGHVFGLDPRYRCLRAWTLEGRRGPVLGLAPFLTDLDERLMGIALVPSGELLVLTSGPRVLRFRLNF